MLARGESGQTEDLMAQEWGCWSGWSYIWSGGVRIKCMHQQTFTLVCPTAPVNLCHKTPASLFPSFLRYGSSPLPLLPRALCGCYIPHRALGLQVSSSCCPLLYPCRPIWGSCATSLSCLPARDPCVPWGKSLCLLTSTGCSSNSLFQELMFYLLKHALCPVLQTKFLLPDHWQGDPQFLSYVYYYYLSSFSPEDKLFGLLRGMLSCLGKMSRDETSTLVIERSVNWSWLFQADTYQNSLSLCLCKQIAGTACLPFQLSDLLHQALGPGHWQVTNTLLTVKDLRRCAVRKLSCYQQRIK